MNAVSELISNRRKLVRDVACQQLRVDCSRELHQDSSRVESLEFYFQYGVVSKIYKDNNLIVLPTQLTIPLNDTLFSIFTLFLT